MTRAGRQRHGSAIHRNASKSRRPERKKGVAHATRPFSLCCVVHATGVLASGRQRSTGRRHDQRLRPGSGRRRDAGRHRHGGTGGPATGSHDRHQRHGLLRPPGAAPRHLPDQSGVERLRDAGAEGRRGHRGRERPHGFLAPRRRPRRGGRRLRPHHDGGDAQRHAVEPDRRPARAGSAR